MAKNLRDIENPVVIDINSKKRFTPPTSSVSYLKCAGCDRPARYNVHGQPHCEKHMMEALCEVPTPVSTIDGGYDDAS